MSAATPALAQLNSNHRARRDDFVTDHLHLVTAIAAHVLRSIPVHIDLDDLIHAGTMGLLDAATKYRDDKEVAFPTYAKHRIRGAILDSLRKQDWASRDLRKRYRQMEAVTAELTSKLGRSPSEQEIASAMGLNSKRWQSLMVDFRSLNAAVLQQLPREENEPFAAEIPAAPTASPEHMFASVELKEKMTAAMETLPERYRQVVSLYYQHELPMKEIGTRLGVNESRVSQIHKSALERMRDALSVQGICAAAAF
jgi:RNA polymerase sigma factor FliA